MASGSGRGRQKYNVTEVLSLLNLDDTESGSDLDYNDLNDTSSESDSDATIHEVAELVTKAPTVRKKRKLQAPGSTPARDWTEITDMKKDKLPDGSNYDFTENVGPTKDIPADAPAEFYFEQFFLADNGTSLWDILVLETNKYQER